MLRNNNNKIMVHGQARGHAVDYVVLLKQLAHVLALVEADGARCSVLSDVHANDVRQFTLVIDVKP
jgi:hypothetical protein